MDTQFHLNYSEVSCTPNLPTEGVPAKTQAFFHKAFPPTMTDNDFVDLFTQRLTVAMSRLPFPMDAAACATSIFHTIWAVKQWLLPQMAAPCLKLARNAQHFGPPGGVVGRDCPFCGGPTTDSFTHFLQCTEMFGMVQDVLPRLAWAPAQPGRDLEFFGRRCRCPAADPHRHHHRRTRAALVAHKRSARAARGAPV